MSDSSPLKAYFRRMAKVLLRQTRAKAPGIFLIVTRMRVTGGSLAKCADLWANMTLMKAQHAVARLAGAEKWSDLLALPPAELEQARLKFESICARLLPGCGDPRKVEYADDDFDPEQLRP